MENNVENAEFLIEKLLNFYKASNVAELSTKINTSQKTISNWKIRNSINAIKKRCRELGIYTEIFGDLSKETNNFHNTNFSGNSSGVDNSNNKNINSSNDDLDCDDFTKSLFKQLCNVYKDKKTLLQTKLFELIQNEQSNK